MKVADGYSLKWDSAWGWTIACDDMDKAPCPMCVGAGEITDDNGYDENGNLTVEFQVICPRCQGKGTFRLEQDDNGA